VVAVGVIVLVLFYNSLTHVREADNNRQFMLEKRFPGHMAEESVTLEQKHRLPEIKAPAYNATYPFTAPTRTEKGVRYRIAIIADLDTNSKKGEEEWISYLKSGSFYLDMDNNKVLIQVYSI